MNEAELLVCSVFSVHDHSGRDKGSLQEWCLLGVRDKRSVLYTYPTSAAWSLQP